MSITASCGCKVESVDHLVHVEYDDEAIDYDEGKFVPVLITGCYCSKCAIAGFKAGHLRPDRYSKPEDVI